MQSAWWIHCYQSTSQRELNAGWINGGSGPNSFQKAASFQLLLLLMFIPRSPFCLLSCILCLPSSPQGLDKYSFYLFPFSDEDPPPPHLSLWSLSSFLVSVFSIYLSITGHISVASFFSVSLFCYLFVFPFSFCHHKLPLLSVSPSQHSILSICMSPSLVAISHQLTLFVFLLLPCICPSIPSRVSRVL